MTNATQEEIHVEPISVRSAEIATKEADSTLSMVKIIVVKNDDQRRDAAETFNQIRERMKRIEDERKKITGPLNVALDAVNALFKKPYTMLKEARDITEKACIAYDQEKERIRQEQERKLREAAQREEDRKKKELEAKAAKAEASGKVEKAEALRQQAQETFVPAPVVVAEKVKVAGTKDVTRWDYEITDINAIPDDYWCLDESKIAKVVSATKGTVAIPGIKAFPVKKLA